MDSTERLGKALNKLTKWRSVFAGWQLGTRDRSDAESQAVRDHRELSMILRVEVSALAKVLIDKGFFTVEEFNEALILEAEELEKIYERKFRGFKATPEGMSMDIAQIQEHGTMEGWRP